MGITQELARYCHSLKFRQLPKKVIDRIKYFFLDFIGVACLGSQEESSKSVYQFIRVNGLWETWRCHHWDERKSPFQLFSTDKWNLFPYH